MSEQAFRIRKDSPAVEAASRAVQKEQAFRYAMRPADPLHRREHPGATEVVQLYHDEMRRIVGVYKTPDAAQKVACDLDESAGDQIA